VLRSDGDEELIDAVPIVDCIGDRKIVAAGRDINIKGTEDVQRNITAIVTVADDGGSSGGLRRNWSAAREIFVVFGTGR